MPRISDDILCKRTIAGVFRTVGEVSTADSYTNGHEGGWTGNFNDPAEVAAYCVPLHKEVGDHLVVCGVQAHREDADEDMIWRRQFWDGFGC